MPISFYWLLVGMGVSWAIRQVYADYREWRPRRKRRPNPPFSDF